MRIQVFLVVLSYFILIATDLVIINDLKRMSLFSSFKPKGKKTGGWWKTYSIFAILVLIVLTIAICLPRRDNETSLAPVMWLLYIVLTVVLAQSIYAICSLMGFIPAFFRKPRWNTGLWIGLPLGILVFSMMWWGAFIGRHRIQTVEVEISSPRLPESFEGYRIAQISDLHVGTWNNDTTFVAKVVKKVNSLHPDLIVFTGDLVNRSSGELLPFINTLSRLDAPDGVLSVLGNHDYGDYVTWDTPSDKTANLDSLKSYQRRMGWELMNNRHLSICNEKGDSIIMIGVGNWGEPPFSQYGDLSEAYPVNKLRDDNFKILLSHNPEHWNREVSKLSNIDLTLSGHTHAMQIMFKFGNWKWSPSQYKYDQWGGIYSRENDEGVPTKVYVNIGAGEVGIPMRIGADPEITIFTLHRVK